MTGEPRHIYLFRSEGFAHGSSTVVCAAPIDLAALAFGGGGRHDEEGVRRAFGGNAFYRNNETGERFIGVWGARKAARYCAALRRHAQVVIVRERPPARLAWWGTWYARPSTSAHNQTHP